MTDHQNIDAVALAKDLVEAQLAEIRQWTIGLRTGARVTLDLPTRDALALVGSLTAAMAKPGAQVFFSPELLTVLRADQVDYIYPAPSRLTA